VAAVRLVRFDNAAAVARAAAERLLAFARERPEAVVAFPTGRTPLPLYAELARRHAAGDTSLARVRGFNLDELVLPPSDERSFRSFMERHAWGHTGLDRTRCDIPDPVASDLGAECRRYEEAITAAGGLDLALLGIGADGHVAYNLPGPPVDATHVVELPASLADELGVPPAARPLRALTMGLGTIGRARRLLVLATGAHKAEAVRRLRAALADPAWPATYLAEHAELEVLVDAAAAGDP
jgi:glucosamine-6-phosphate deaminase